MIIFSVYTRRLSSCKVVEYYVGSVCAGRR